MIIDCSTIGRSGSISSVTYERWSGNHMIVSGVNVYCTTRTLSRILSKVRILYSTIRTTPINCTTIRRRTSFSNIIGERWTSYCLIGITSIIITDCTTKFSSAVISKVRTYYITIFRWSIIDRSTTISTTSSISSVIGERWTSYCLIIRFWIVDCSTRSLSWILGKVRILYSSIFRWIESDCST